MWNSSRCEEGYLVRINCELFLWTVGLRTGLLVSFAQLAKSDLFMLCVPIPLSGNNMALVERAGLGIIYGGFNTHTIYKLCAINFLIK